jgi:hypothetical protein
VRRPRTEGWESKLTPQERVELEEMRTHVDALELEYERTSLPATLGTLKTAKIRLVRHTSSLQRQVADAIIRVRFYSYSFNNH